MAQLDSAQIAQLPKCQALSRREKRVLIGWGIFSTLFYFGLPIWAGNTHSQSDIGNMKIIGKVPLLYLYALAQYALCLLIAIYYYRWANKNSDRISNELAKELKL
jgi:uncharacterized membrane protein (DUF485 family)